ncbi:MAG: hypothetical protein KA750_06440 [Thermoflexales bacterium]|nr:hypothetical protein [Thermoflexales bacterium]
MMNPAIPQEEPALVCTNIGPRERRKRLYFGIAAEVMALAVLAAVKILKLSGWTAAITLPFFIAAGIGFFQWLEKTCIANVYLGVTNMDDGNVAVTNEAVKRTLAKQARQVQVKAFVSAMAQTAVAVLIAAL